MRFTHVFLMTKGGEVRVQHTPCTIVIVDDEPSILRVLTAVLRRQGSLVTTTAHGALAWACLHRHAFDGIWCDLRMPELDGPAFYRFVQRHDPALAARVIVLTGDTVSATSMAFLRASGQPWVSQPFAASEVLRMLAKVLHTAQARVPHERGTSTR